MTKLSLVFVKLEAEAFRLLTYFGNDVYDTVEELHGKILGCGLKDTALSVDFCRPNYNCISMQSIN